MWDRQRGRLLSARQYALQTSPHDHLPETYTTVMHRLGSMERVAMARLPNDTARIVIQRWLELTGAETHPEWLWKGLRFQSHESPLTLIGAISNNQREKAVALVEPAVTHIMESMGTRTWQHALVSSFLLDAQDRFGPNSATPLSFLERMQRLFNGPQISLDPESVYVDWPVEPALAKSVRLPVENPAVRIGNESPTISVYGSSGERKLKLRTKATNEPSSISLAATTLRAQGSAVLDLLRVALPDQNLIVSNSMSSTSARLPHLKGEAMPRLERYRTRMIVRHYLMELSNRDLSDEDIRAVSAMRWISMANARWHESHSVATAMLWPALEILHSKCVWKHVRRCSCAPGTVLPIDAYISSLRDNLTREINSYLRSLWAKKNDRQVGRVVPPQWLRPTLLAIDEDPIEWLRKVAKAARGSVSEDPLLHYRIYELTTLGDRKLNDIRKRCELDISELYQARNSLFHEGVSDLREERARYLAALAVELLLLTLESRAQLS